MCIKLHYCQLSEINREVAQKRWANARPNDGYRYELGIDGKPLCRKRASANTWGFDPIRGRRHADT